MSTARTPVTPASPAPLSPTPRTTVTRGRNRAVAERDVLLDVLAAGLVAHVGVDAGSHPLVLPAAYAVDPAGPDPDGTLYLHGSVAAGWLGAAAGTAVCVSVTLLDGLVAGRSAFHHSMNYRSAVVIGSARVVRGRAERQRALDLIVDHMLPGRSTTLRASTRKELAATAVLAVPLHEASVKVRDGGPGDEPSDVAAGVWGGHVPVRLVAGTPVADPDAAGPVPDHVTARAAALGADVVAVSAAAP